MFFKMAGPHSGTASHEEYCQAAATTVRSTRVFDHYKRRAPKQRAKRQRQIRVCCLSWNWRERSSVKITVRTHAKKTKALHRGRESSHPKTALDKVLVSDLCEELELQPTVFYRSLKEFFEN
jgi:hypothetical protein